MSSQCRISLTDWRHIFGYRPRQPGDISTEAATKHHSQWWSPSEICFFFSPHGSSCILGGVPSACFCLTFQSVIAYNVTMITFLFDALSRTQWNSFPCWKKLPQDRICRGPFEHFEHLFSKETETVFQFSSNPSHQQYDIPWINIHNSWNSFSFCFSKIGIRKRASGMNLISDFALRVKRVFSRRGILTFHLIPRTARQVHLQFLSNFYSKQPRLTP